MTAQQRSAVYAAVPPATAVLVAFGLIAEEQAPVVGGAVVALAGVVVAFLHRPTRRI